MSNAVGGQVRVTLTLNDAGFTMKIREAGNQVKSLGTQFSGLGKTTDALETKLGTLGKNVSMSSNNLKTLQSSAKTLETQFKTLQKSMSDINAGTAAVSSNAALLNGVVLKLAALLDQSTASSKRAAGANKELATSQRDLNASTATTVNGLTAQERLVRNLGTAHMKTAQQIVQASGMRKNATVAAAAAEIESNNRMIVSKKNALAGMIKAEREYQRSLELEKSKQMALQQRVDSRRDANGRMMGANSPQLAQYQRELELQNQKVAALQRGLGILTQESVKLQGNLNILGQQNVKLEGRIGLEGRIEQALIRQKARAAEYLLVQQRQTEQQRTQTENLRQQMDMIKGMGQLYAGMKIAQGEKASVRAAGEFERTNVRAKSMGMTKEEQEQFDYMVKHDSKGRPGLSYNDAATARIAAMGGLATTNQRQINQILPTAMDAAQNIQYITGDEGNESFENYIRNLTGVAEARQVQYNPEQTKKTMELMQRIMVATGNKIDIPDVETFLRRIGPGGASQISDQGIINSVALLDQMKVSGGAGGGGAGGVSTVGTMFKMMTAYATGKTMSNEMVRQAADSGILNTDGIGGGKKADGSDKGATPEDNSLKQVMSEAKKAGFKNSQLFNTDPVTAIRQMMATVLGTISSEANRQKYFGNADVNDPEAQRAALSKWATRNGTTTTASQLLVTIADPRMQERVDHQSDMIKGSSSIEELKQLRMDTYEQQVKNFDASLANLKVTMGATILPMLTDFFNWMSKTIDKATEFATNNPMVAEMTMIGGAVAGAVLTLSGMARMFGLLAPALGGAAASTGLLAGAFRFLLGPLKLITVPLGLLWRGIVALGSALAGPIIGAVTGLGARLTGLLAIGAGVRAGFSAFLAPIVAFGAQILGLGARFFALGPAMAIAAKVIGGVFLRMIPFVGWLYTAWELGGLLLQFQVGFASIGEWISHWMTGMLNKASTFATELRNAFRISDDSKAEGQMNVRIAEQKEKDEDSRFERIRKRRKRAKEREDRLEARDNKAKTDAEAKKAQDLQDMIEGKGFTHTDKLAEINPNTNPYVMPEAPPKKEPRAQREPRDQFVRSLADITKNAETTAMKISAAIRNTSDTLGEQARVEFFEKWRAGDFDPGHDASKRPFKNKTGGLDWQAAGKDGGPAEWLKTREAMLQQEEQLKGLTYANERIAAAREDANTAAERGIDTTAKESREMSGLQRELARTEERLRNGTKEFGAWNAKKNQALFERSRADVGNFTADFAEGDRTTQEGMIYSTKDQAGAKFDNQAQKDRETYDLRMKAMVEYYTKAKAGLAELNLSEAERAAQGKLLDKEFNDARTKSETEFTNHVKVQADARAFAMRGAIAKMQLDWENSFEKLDEVVAGWGNTFMDNVTTALTGGEVSWRQMLANMLKDVLQMQLKQAFAVPMSSALEGLNGMLSGLFANKPKTDGAAAGQVAGAVAGGSGIMSGIGGALSSAGGAIKGGFASAAKFFGLDGLAGAADAGKTALSDMTANGVNQATQGLAQQVTQVALSTSTEVTAATTTTGFMVALQGATAAAYAFAAAASSGAGGSAAGGIMGGIAAAFGASAGGGAAAAGGGAAAATSAGSTAAGYTSAFGFANGGIMSSMGPIPLKAYANGGIASSPQLALFGEGRMKEAFVPLPDGRSIPVTFAGGAPAGGSGGGGQIVNINIVVNNDGTESSNSEASTDSDKDVWNKLAGKVKTVVRDELLTQLRPNGILNRK